MGEGKGPAINGGRPAEERLSAGAVPAWRIAAAEARHAAAASIENEHLLIGLLSLEKALAGDCSSNLMAAKKVMAEKESIDLLVGNAGTGVIALRRNVRAALPEGAAEYRGGVVHRSRECRASFERAAHLAGAREVTIVHLLSAVLENPGPVISAALDGDGDATGSAQPVLVRLARAARDYLRTQETEIRMCKEIEESRRTISTLSRNSGEYLRIRQELGARTARLALVCLGIRDIGGLLFALRGLAVGSDRQDLAIIIRQLDYMQDNGIMLGERSAAILQGVVEDLPDAAAVGEKP